ncbi:MAG: ABC-F family ATP-binding cassette domain-containing protein [Bacteroidota bacterium]|nr:ABC-F family ATP-binding cassette domain-containing protein [Bacteroidota bacterium]
MLEIQNISFEFAGRYLYKDINWTIKPNERIGLVGRNGTGKSTLLKIIHEDIELREGRINKPKQYSIGYLYQDLISFNTDLSIKEVAIQAFEKLQKLQVEIDEILTKIENNYSDNLIDILGEKQALFEQLGGYTMENETEEILLGLGFENGDLIRPMNEFSGGWRMRVILAKMLLRKPDLLLLDEPTNHLDLPSIEWLEKYLNNFQGSVVVVSHDQEFLNRICTKTVEIANKRVYEWAGNYDFFLRAKIERDDLQQKQFESQQQYIKDQEKFITRFRAKATKAKAVQSRIKLLEKLERFEEVAQDNQAMNVNFSINRPTGRMVRKLEDISKSYVNKSIVKNVNREILRDDKIALIGANGTGKSTLLRILSGDDSFEGKVINGHNVDESFYAQHQLESLTLENEILDELIAFAPHKTETELRTLLGCFLFEGDDVYKKIKVLSGGEKARVALAKTLTTGANFLLLDEPTNHLDMQSIDVLIRALNNYEGSYVIVSHNRHFVSKTSNKVWWIENQDIKEYPGNYTEFVDWKNKTTLTSNPYEKEPSKGKKNLKTKAIAKPLDIDEISVEKQIENLENRLFEYRQKLLIIEQDMASEKNYRNSEKMKKLNQDKSNLFKVAQKLEEDIEVLYSQL